MPKVTIVMPCYYNEGNIPVTTKALIDNEVNFPSDVTFEYIFVDDGSKDNTFGELLKFQRAHPQKVKVIRLARNFGANNASYAGITHATGDCMVILAADLQDPPEFIPKLYEHWTKGFKLALAYRADREDTWLTKLISNTYHNLIRKIALPNSPKGGFDLWLFDKQLRDEVVRMNEKNFYLPYLFIWLGFEYVSIPYTRRKREIGTSRWTLTKKLKSFVDSFVSFTYFPLRLISFTGLLFGFVAIIYALSILYKSFTTDIPVQGWSSLMVAVLLSSAVIMVSLGVIGEYLYRVLDASRNRPNYIIDNILDETKRAD